MCRVYFYQATMGKSIQKTEKIVNYPSYQLVAGTLGIVRKKETISKNKTTTLMFFDNLKKKQQDQSSKNWCTAETFMSLTISNLRISVFCSENTKL